MDMNMRIFLNEKLKFWKIEFKGLNLGKLNLKLWFYHFSVFRLIVTFSESRPTSFSVLARILSDPGMGPDSTIFPYLTINNKHKKILILNIFFLPIVLSELNITRVVGIKAFQSLLRTDLHMSHPHLRTDSQNLFPANRKRKDEKLV